MRSCSVMMAASFVVIYHYDDIWHKLHGCVQQKLKVSNSDTVSREKMKRQLTIPDFISIDFETATSRMDSACAVGIVAVKGEEIIDRYYSLIQPPGNMYDAQNIEVHGITPEATEKERPFWKIWYDDLIAFFGRCPVVAHNAKFDMSVLDQCCKRDRIEPDNFKYIDTMNLCKGIVKGTKSLSNCAEWFGIPMGQHHNALADAEACAKVALACVRASGEERLIDFCFRQSHVKIYNFSDLQPMEVLKHQENKERQKHFESVSPREICPCTDAFDQNHPLCGKSIVFTGELSIDRRSAMQMAADVGALVKSGVSKKTDYLVVGAQDPTLVGDDGRSTKEEKAYELNESGKANICILSEKEFIDLVKACPSAGKELTQV